MTHSPFSLLVRRPCCQRQQTQSSSNGALYGSSDKSRNSSIVVVLSVLRQSSRERCYGVGEQRISGRSFISLFLLDHSQRGKFVSTSLRVCETALLSSCPGARPILSSPVRSVEPDYSTYCVDRDDSGWEKLLVLLRNSVELGRSRLELGTSPQDY